MRAPHRGAADGSPGGLPCFNQPSLRRSDLALCIVRRPARHSPDYRLATRLDVDVLDPDRLLNRLSSQACQRFNLRRECSKQLRAEVSVRRQEIHPIRPRRPPQRRHCEVVATDQLYGKESLKLGTGLDTRVRRR